MSEFQEYLYIDYENVQELNVGSIKNSVKVKIIVGENQTKIPIDYVQKLQPYGNSVEWIRVDVKGKNALDFILAFYLGKDVAEDREKTFTIYSQDKGYDPLISYLKKDGIKARRMGKSNELTQNKVIRIDEAGFKQVKESLSKITANQRPKQQSKLTGFIRGQCRGLLKQDIDVIIKRLYKEKINCEENGRLKYSLAEK